MGLLDAAAAQSLLEYEQALFELLSHHIQFDVAFCVRADGPSQYAPGLDARVRSDSVSRLCSRKPRRGPRHTGIRMWQERWWIVAIW
ncbi:MAG: hypothetical protein RL701_3934 [Pseudomonadota bacterium]